MDVLLSGLIGFDSVPNENTSRHGLVTVTYVIVLFSKYLSYRQEHFHLYEAFDFSAAERVIRLDT